MPRMKDIRDFSEAIVADGDDLGYSSKYSRDKCEAKSPFT